DAHAAQVAYAAAASLQRKLISDFPQVLQYQGDLALTLNNLGALAFRQEQKDEAQTSYREAIGIQTKLARQAPLVAAHRQDLAVTYNNLGYSQGASAEAIESFQQARSILLQLVEEYPHGWSYRS